jgi:hypothetical protein
MHHTTIIPKIKNDKGVVRVPQVGQGKQSGEKLLLPYSKEIDYTLSRHIRVVTRGEEDARKHAV